MCSQLLPHAQFTNIPPRYLGVACDPRVWVAICFKLLMKEDSTDGLVVVTPPYTPMSDREERQKAIESPYHSCTHYERRTGETVRANR